MITKTPKQLYIAVEGLDGSGKTTTVNFIEQLIRYKGYNCLTIREPGGTALSEKIRTIIKTLDELPYRPSDSVLSMLVNAARLDNLEQLIDKASEDFILTDRCYLSTFVYQNRTNLNPTLCRLGTRDYNRVPDIVFILDVDYRTSYNRIVGRGLKTDSLEEVSAAVFDARRAVYLSFLKEQNGKTRFIHINAAQDRELVEEDICNVLEQYL